MSGCCQARRLIIQASNSKKNAASKYCFKASAHLKCKSTNRIIATFSAYDKSPLVGETVEKLCRSYLDEEDGLAKTMDVELVFYKECPTECDGETSVIFYSVD